jgi:hypothetical protein
LQALNASHAAKEKAEQEAWEKGKADYWEMKEAVEKEAGVDVIRSSAEFEAAIAAAGEKGLAVYYGAANLNIDTNPAKIESLLGFLELSEGLKEQGYATALLDIASSPLAEKPYGELDEQFIHDSEAAYYFVSRLQV